MRERHENKGAAAVAILPLAAQIGRLGTDLVGFQGALTGLYLAHRAREQALRVVIVPTRERARELADEVAFWLGADAARVAAFLPARRSVYDQTDVDGAVMRERLAALGLGVSGGGVVIVPVTGLLERFQAPAHWLRAVVRLQRGQTCERSRLLLELAGLGYKRVAQVEGPGTFAVRGSLVDVMGAQGGAPVRLDFFGDDLEAIKLFSLETQRTLAPVERVVLLPAVEQILDDAAREALFGALRRVHDGLTGTLAETCALQIDRLLAGAASHEYYNVLPFLGSLEGQLLEFWPGAEIWLDEPEQYPELLNEFVREQATRYDNEAALTFLQPPLAYYHDVAVAQTVVARSSVCWRRFARPGEPGDAGLAQLLPPPNAPDRPALVDEVRRLTRDGYAVALVLQDAERFQNLKGMLADARPPLPLVVTPDLLAMPSGSLRVERGPIRQGFIAPGLRVAVFAESDLYVGPKPKVRAKKSRRGQPLEDLELLMNGDLVVHVDHGIAEYRGVQRVDAAGHEREYLLLQYAGEDRLYVPTDQMHKVQKYVGMEGFRPALHALNSKSWEKQRKKISANVEELAGKLLELYARREVGSGFAFPADDELQTSMEARFPYVETEDQMAAIDEVKTDMMAAKPMDRLVCGDVGYGKTEVAMRAAFKAVTAGKQVAVLVPTTLLAFQHEQSFKNRMDGFPVRVDMVSRLRSATEQKRTLTDLTAGKVDIIIGTHRLLSGDVKFKDLGLLVIDEEQRFGVKHKERLKEMRATVDVLAMSATPIPRTLHLALSGVRQISQIDTPPDDRLPVQTYVAPYDGQWARKAILDEIRRGGQVFWVFNRVEKIEAKAEKIRELVPEARLMVAHGQMDEDRVEQVLLAFIRREFDILLSTTIIESGLDIPNANTIIIDEAERLGLSQLYQLRGRVGRSGRQAWAYIFFTKGKRLTPEASQRLMTIAEHTALGSGFKIALRDLQIRGAGNILGAEQSGHIAAIGFQLYLEMLEEAVRRLRGEAVARPPECKIEVPLTALIPDDYVADEGMRIDLYARIGRIGEEATLTLLAAECEDRFGPLPEQLQMLFAVARLRILAARVGVAKITRVLDRLRCEFDPLNQPDVDRLMRARARMLARLQFVASDPRALHLRVGDLDDAGSVTAVTGLLEALAPA